MRCLVRLSHPTRRITGPPITPLRKPAASSPKRLNRFGQRQPIEENMMLIVSDETHDMTTADSVRPSSENTHTTVRSGEMVATGVIGTAWARGVIGRVFANSWRLLDAT